MDEKVLLFMPMNEDPKVIKARVTSLGRGTSEGRREGIPWKGTLLPSSAQRSKQPASPFSTYGDAHEVIGLRRGSRVIGRYIDIGKMYKDKGCFAGGAATSC